MYTYIYLYLYSICIKRSPLFIVFFSRTPPLYSSTSLQISTVHMCSKLKLFFTVYTLKATGNGMESGGCQVFNNVLGEESLEFFFLQQNSNIQLKRSSLQQ